MLTSLLASVKSIDRFVKLNLAFTKFNCMLAKFNFTFTKFNCMLTNFNFMVTALPLEGETGEGKTIKILHHKTQHINILQTLWQIL